MTPKTSQHVTARFQSCGKTEQTKMTAICEKDTLKKSKTFKSPPIFDEFHGSQKLDISYFWPNFQYFSNLDFPEIAGDFPYLYYHLGVQVVFSVAINCPRLSGPCSPSGHWVPSPLGNDANIGGGRRRFGWKFRSSGVHRENGKIQKKTYTLED